jgi:hypothetical protein
VTARITSFSAAKARLGFSFSGQQFKKRLLDLTEHNNTLQSILAQVQRMHNTTSQPTLSSVPLVVARSYQTRTAAMRVYNSLRLACSAHNGHFVYLSLEDLQIQSRNNPLSVGIDVGLQPTTDRLDILIEPPIRFVVRSMPSSRERNPPVVPFVREDDQDGTEPKVKSKRKRKPDPLPIDGQENKKLKHEATVEETALSDLEERSLSDIQWLDIGQGILRSSEESRISMDLAVNSDFCKQIRGYPQNLPRLDELGCLNVRPYPELRVYSPREPAPCQPPLSLSDLLLKRLEDNYGVGLLPHEILHLAKRAALALLHFHTTPLLTPDWSGGNIVFFETDKKTWYRQPHLKVNTAPSAQIRSSTSTGIRCIRNPYTFSLGCLLIELAHQGPLSDLQEPDDIVDGEDGLETRFNISSRVSKSVFMALGTDYRAVVRQCIYCDFGKDNDLEEPALQVAFERDVISVLERLERKY